VVCDPSHMRTNEINIRWSHWERRSNAKKRLVTFIKARKCDMRTDLMGDLREKRRSKKKKPYVEVSSDKEEEPHLGDEEEEPSHLVTTLATAAPAHIARENRFEFLNALSTDQNYLELVDAAKDLSIATEHLVSVD
jgi:chromosome condensin MukBEF ATPase and DNA-binding subunit MukB